MYHTIQINIRQLGNEKNKESARGNETKVDFALFISLSPSIPQVLEF